MAKAPGAAREAGRAPPARDPNSDAGRGGGRTAVRKRIDGFFP